jgi:hypothetical protein
VGLAAVHALTEKQQDVVMLEEQIQKAMNELRVTFEKIVCFTPKFSAEQY